METEQEMKTLEILLKTHDYRSVNIQINRWPTQSEDLGSYKLR